MLKLGKFGIGQVETVDLGEFKEKESSIVIELDKIRKEGNYHSVILFITDIIKEGSLFLVSTSDEKKLEKWSDEIEDLLSEWAEIGLCYGWLHNYSERKYKKKYHRFSIPIIVLSTLTGTANFADSYVPSGFKQGFSAIVGGFNISEWV